MFSILTPTYNRAKELPRVYNSLRNQTFLDFEWIIADDGSTDGTGDLVKAWQKTETAFKITFHLLAKNQGKSYAVNEGLDLCKRPYTLIADSDDTFTDTTLEDLKLLWEAIERSIDKEKIGAIWTLVEDEKGRLVGEKFPKNLWQVGFEERVLNRKKPIAGEKWHCWRTNILNEYKMFVNPNSFISEAATWDLINSKYDFLCANLIHRRYWFSQEGMIHQSKPYSETQKVIYYTSYYHLSKSKTRNILRTKHYRKIAFDFIRSSFYHKDEEFNLARNKKICSWLIFLWYLPKKVLHKLLPLNKSSS